MGLLDRLDYPRRQRWHLLHLVLARVSGLAWPGQHLDHNHYSKYHPSRDSLVDVDLLVLGAEQ